MILWVRNLDRNTLGDSSGPQLGLVHLAAKLRWFVESNTASLTCLNGNSCKTGLSWAPLSLPGISGLSV